MLKRRKGQSTLEYAVIIAVVVGALLAMQIYMKRGVQGRLRGAADDIGKQFDAGLTSVNYTSGRRGKTVEKTVKGATDVYSGEGGLGSSEVSTYSGKETVNAWPTSK